ncbi:hypothetical protein DRI38_004766 [Escherichia coli]|nr:hypothetical protein [Escherichia coli]
MGDREVKVRCTIDKSMMDKLHKELSQMDGVAVGWDDGKHYSGLNYATLAAIHSEGWGDLPKRSFMESAHTAMLWEAHRHTKALINAIVKGGSSEAVRKRIGKRYADILETILVSGQFSSNKVSPEWANYKGFNEAMRHYDDLLGAIKYWSNVGRG